MRTFSQVPMAIWRNSKFLALSDDARLALMFCWSGPHATSAGVGPVLDAYASHDLRWQLDRWQAARAELEAVGFIRRDEATETILVADFFKANRPSSARHIAAVRNQIASVSCPELQDLALSALLELLPTPAPSANVRNLETGFLSRAPR